MITETRKRDIALVVDDSADTLRMLMDALDGAGMTVMVALDGMSALRIVEQITPDVILLDAMMPGIDGFETCRRVKREPALADTPVIFMTGLSETNDIVRGLEAGGVDYVTKPIVVQEMIARIRVHLSNARLTQSARAALDVSGRYLLSVTETGAIRWVTPQAQKLLASITARSIVGEDTLPTDLLPWLSSLRGKPAPHKGFGPSPALAGSELRLHYLGLIGGDEILLRLAKEVSAALSPAFNKDFGLTNREGEVLSWLAKGKTNRDIAQILGLSPRTVDKHLEQVYAKLGVDNRTAAAAVAARAG